jgi:hypothetical protein
MVAHPEPYFPPANNGQKRIKQMKLTTNDSDVQSLIGESVSPEYLYQDREAELLAADAEDFEGYSEWSADIEQDEFECEQERKSTVETEHGAVLMVRDCSHAQCKTSRCRSRLRLGGIEI